MRVSTGYEFEAMRARMAGAQARLSEAQRRLATGRRFETAAEDPDAARRIVRNTALRDWVAQTEKNLRVATDYLGTAENALTETVKGLREAYAIAVRGADTTASVSERQTLAREVETIQRRLADLANSRGAGGQYVFGGHESRKQPFRTVDGLIYEGDGGAVRVEVDPGKQMQVNLQGAPDFFVQAYARLSALRDHLMGGDPGTIGNVDLPMIQGSIDDALALSADVGYRRQDVAMYSARHQLRADELEGLISDDRDVDLTDAVTQLQLAETAYQAALRSAAVASRLRLMDFLQ